MRQPPPYDYIKINVDVSFVESFSAASVGVFARNSSSDALISSWEYISLCTTIDEAELRTCLAGLSIGNRDVILETNCSYVVSFLANDSLDWSSLVDLKKEALSITKLLHNFKLAKINRRANEVAHQIAKFSFDNKSEDILCNSFSNCVIHALRNDCNNILIN